LVRLSFDFLTASNINRNSCSWPEIM
jgi:hypothetical protein